MVAAVQAAYVLMDREVTTSKSRSWSAPLPPPQARLIVFPRGVRAGSADLDRRGADPGR
jgi:hypothetical protein